MRLEASDGYSSESGEFKLFIENENPTLKGVPIDQEIVLGRNYDYIFAQNLFEDQDRDELFYKAYYLQ